jgi:hypothetical protein
LEIKQINDAVVAGVGFPEFSLCERCGKPIIAFLKKRKLLQPKTSG